MNAAGAGCLWVLLLGTACATPGPADAPPSPPGLPGFGGCFRGTLQIFGPRPRTVPMGLDVLPRDGGTWSWVMHYGEGPTAERRDYLLRIDDAAAGRYRIDEQNGIVLAAQAVGSELVSVFTAGGQTLVVRYRAMAEGLEFALEAFDPAKAEPTGQGVGTVALPASQRAVLRRVDGMAP